MFAAKNEKRPQHYAAVLIFFCSLSSCGAITFRIRRLTVVRSMCTAAPMSAYAISQIRQEMAICRSSRLRVLRFSRAFSSIASSPASAGNRPCFLLALRCALDARNQAVAAVAGKAYKHTIGKGERRRGRAERAGEHL